MRLVNKSEMEREWLNRLDPKERRLKRSYITGQCEIDHDKGNDWLSRVEPDYQRNLAESVVERYATDMNAGNWIPGSQIIAFDSHARLINGQHVLVAFVRSDLKTLEVVWEINRHPQAYMAFDHNRKRTAKDTLKWNGVERPGEMQSAATALWQYEQGCFGGKSYQSARNRFPTDAQVQHTVKMHPGLEKHLWKNPLKGKELSVGALNAASYILHSLDAKRAEKFYECLIENINMNSKHHPVNALIAVFKNLGPKERMRTGDTMARIFKAWNAFVRGEEVTGALLRKDESFPTLLDPENLEPIAPRPDGQIQ